MSPNPPIIITADTLELGLSPYVGGSILWFDWIGGDHRVPVLRKCNSSPENVLDAASFPLVSYVNRVRGGHFSFRGRTITLAPNMAGDVSPLHGQGWLAAWQVESVGRSDAVISFEHRADDWPWDYRAEQHFALDDGGLSLILTCRSLSREPMPCGLGQHPYFNCGPDTRIDTQVTDVWTIDEHVLPVERMPATGRFDLADRLACGQGLDHGFGGWGGLAKMTDPAWPFDLQLSSPDAHFFQLYSPAAGGIFVAEPVTQANAALNAPEQQWPELGMRVLAPDEEMRLAMRLDVIAKPSSRSG